MKVIPAIDIMGGQVVRLLKGNPKDKTVYSSDPVAMAKKWEDAGADLLHVVDLDATLQSGSNSKVIKAIANQVTIPVQTAGGLRTMAIVEEFLEFSKKIVVGTIAFKDRSLLDKIAEKFGRDRIVISVDHYDGKVVTHGWQQSTDVQLIEALHSFAEQDFTEFLVTNVSRDGTLQGPDLDSLRQICQIPKINIIASGGLSNLEDVRRIKECGAYSVILGKALYDGKVTIQEAKRIA